MINNHTFSCFTSRKIVAFQLFFIFILILPGISQITYLDKTTDGQDGIYGLAGTRGISLSPDKKNIYLTSQYAISVFDYDSLSNTLSFLESYKEGEGGLDELYGATCIISSNDNRKVYVASESHHSILIFNRDSITGLLNHYKTIRDNENGIDGLRGVHSIRISNDDRFLYTAAWNDQKISVFSRNSNSGDLEFLQSIDRYDQGGLSWPKSLVLSKDNRHIYVSSHMDDAISVFKIDSLSGTIEYVETLENNVNGVSGLWRVRAVEVSNDDKNVYAITRNAITVFARDSLTGELSFIETHLDNTNGVDGISGSYSITIPDSDEHVYVVSNLDTSLVCFQRNINTGELTYLYHLPAISDYIGDGVYSTTSLISEKDHILLTSYWESAVHSYWRNESSGTVNLDSSYIDKAGSTIKGLAGANYSDISNDDKHVYVSAYYGGVSHFERNDTTGILSFKNAVTRDSLPLYGASGVCLSAENNYLAVCAEESNSVLLFSINPMNGELVYQDIEQFSSLYRFNYISISKDAKNIYAACKTDRIINFSLDSINNIISPIDTLNLFNIRNLNYGISSIDFNDNHDYMVVSSPSNYLLLYKRNEVDGKLELINKYGTLWGDKEELGYLEHLSFIDTSLYVLSNKNQCIYAFILDRNQDSLLLKNTFNFHDLKLSLNTEYSDMKVSPDGRNLFLLSQEDNSITLLLRNIITNELHSSVTFHDSTFSFDGLDELSSIEFSNDMYNLYVTSSKEDGIASFSLDLFLGEDRNFCTGDTFPISVGNHFESYLWSTGDTTNQIEIVSSIKCCLQVKKKYNVIQYDTVNVNFFPLPEFSILDTGWVCINDSIPIVIDRSFEQYQWNNGETDSLIYADTSGLYYVEVTDSNSCINYDTTIIFTNELPPIELGNNIEKCFGDTVEIGINRNFKNYLWNTGSTDSTIIVSNGGRYSLMVTDSNDCSNSDTVEVIYYPKPLVNLGKDTTLTINDTLILYAGNHHEYNWSDGSIESYLVIDSSDFYLDSINIWVQVVDNDMCFSSDTISLVLKKVTNLNTLYAKCSFNLYPNPALHCLNVSIDKEIKNIKIYNIQGKKINQMEVNNKVATIDIINIPPGSYLITVTGDNFFIVEPFIKL